MVAGSQRFAHWLYARVARVEFWISKKDHGWIRTSCMYQVYVHASYNKHPSLHNLFSSTYSCTCTYVILFWLAGIKRAEVPARPIAVPLVRMGRLLVLPVRDGGHLHGPVQQWSRSNQWQLSGDHVIWASAQDTCSVHASIVYYMVNSSPFAISEVKQSHSATRSIDR